MWQMYSLASILTGAFESTSDKAGIVRDSGVDSYVASFYRAFCFVAATSLVAATGLLGEFTLSFHWSYVALGLIIAAATLLFTYLLRSVEITVIGAAAYLAPFLFLIIDTQVLGIGLTQAQIIGIVLLICGGLAFSLDGKTHHFRRDYSWRIWAAILFIYLFAAATEGYAFKYLNTTYDINAISYYISSASFSVCFLFGLLIWNGKIRLLFSRAARAYVPYAALGKSFDAFNSVLGFTALSMATLSQVSAFNALMPLMIVIVAIVIQGLFGIRLKEHLDTKRIGWKLSAAVVLVVGGLLVG